MTMFDVPRKLQYICAKLDLKHWLSDAPVFVEELNEVRDWKRWKLGWFHSLIATVRFEKAPVTFSGASRDDVSGAHAFMFMRRRGRAWFASALRFQIFLPTWRSVLMALVNVVFALQQTTSCAV